MLSAQFLAVIQVLVYAGAIMMLFVFVVMVLNREEVEPGRLARRDHQAASASLAGRLPGLKFVRCRCSASLPGKPGRRCPRLRQASPTSATSCSPTTCSRSRRSRCCCWSRSSAASSSSRSHKKRGRRRAGRRAAPAGHAGARAGATSSRPPTRTPTALRRRGTTRAGAMSDSLLPPLSPRAVR